MSNLSVQYKTKIILPLSLPISQKHYLRHPTQSSWSCHIWLPLQAKKKKWFSSLMHVHFAQQFIVNFISDLHISYVNEYLLWEYVNTSIYLPPHNIHFCHLHFFSLFTIFLFSFTSLRIFDCFWPSGNFQIACNQISLRNKMLTGSQCNKSLCKFQRYNHSLSCSLSHLL